MSTSLRSNIMNQINDLKILSFDSALMQLVPQMLVKAVQISLECAEEVVEHFVDISLDRVQQISTSLNDLITNLNEYRKNLGSAYTELSTKKVMNWQSYIVPVVVH